MRATPLLFPLQFLRFVLSSFHGASKTPTGGNATRQQALFYALFPKSRFFLAVFWAMIASNVCRVSPICPSRKAKGGERFL